MQITKTQLYRHRVAYLLLVEGAVAGAEHDHLIIGVSLINEHQSGRPRSH